VTPREWRRQLLSRQQARAEKWRAAFDRLVASSGREIVTDKALEAARAGRIGDVVASLGRPSLGAIERLLREIAGDGWRAGITDAEAALAGMRDDGDFAEPTDDEIRAMVRTSRLRAGLPPLDLPRDVVLDSIYLEEARRAARGFTVAVAAMLREAAVADREIDAAARERQDVGKMLALAERIRNGDVEAIAEAKATYKGPTAVGLDVDWTAGQAAQIARTKIDPGVAAYQWITAADEVVTCVCGFLQSNTILVSDPELMFFAPRLHYNCLLPGARIEGRIEGASRAWYSGETIEIETVGGRRLSVTPQHPILTPAGWVAAGQLREGQHVIGYGARVEDDPSGAPSLLHDEEHPPARVEEVFGAFWERGGASAIDVGALDFHGEARHFDGQVEVVGAYRELLLDADAAGAEFLGEGVLELAASSQAEVVGLRGRELLGHRLLAAGSGAPRGRALLLDYGSVLGGAATLAPLSLLCLGSASRLNVGLQQTAADGRAGHSCRTSQLQFARTSQVARAHVRRDVAPIDDRDPGGDQGGANGLLLAVDLPRQMAEADPPAVSLDEIRYLRRRQYSGHVYDLQSSPGWIVANGIVTSNCRCALAPRRLGISSITWDVVRSVVVRDCDGVMRSLRAAPRWVDVPQGKPNQPPPEKASDWIHGRRPTPPQVGRLVDDGGKMRKMGPGALAREFERQIREALAKPIKDVIPLDKAKERLDKLLGAYTKDEKQ